MPLAAQCGQVVSLAWVESTASAAPRRPVSDRSLQEPSRRGDFCNAIAPRRRIGAYWSGETDVLPQSSQRRYTTGYDSDRPMTLALGIPQRGHTTVVADGRFAT
jgi:hypothetical protein